MTIICHCDVVDTADILTYLRLNGPVLTEKAGSKVRKALHDIGRTRRLEQGANLTLPCARCVLSMLKEIMAESLKMYPEEHRLAA